ncbi:MAG: P-loop NTPase [Microbacteriaceae bacterium]|nr:P-loop NTPase [Microbacteriaceae bacterium]
MTTEQTLNEALGRVIDPELRRPIMELGMIPRVDLQGSFADIDLKLTVVSCPAADRIENDVRSAALSVTGIDKANVNVSVMNENERAELTARLRAGRPKGNPFSEGSKTRVIAISSGKGGVGKSTVVANLAAYLAAAGVKVGVIDADVYGFSQPQLLGSINPDGTVMRPTRLDQMILPPISHGVAVISIGMFLPEGEQIIAWRGPMLHKTLNQFLSDVYFGDLELLLIDMPPGTGDVAISLAQMLPNAEVVVVTTPQTVAADVAVRSGLLSAQSGQKVVGVIETLSPTTDATGNTVAIFGSGGAEKTSKILTESLKYAVPVLGHIPISEELRESGDIGKPLVVQNRRAPAALAFREIAENLGISMRGALNLSK